MRRAWESTLHILAKEVIAAARGIALPEAVAVHGHLIEHVAAARDFAYDAADSELRTGTITPDIVLHGGGRSLLVEVHVTHPAEDAKLEELRLRELPTIEIDLSKAPRHAPRDHHADLILRAAPTQMALQREDGPCVWFVRCTDISDHAKLDTFACRIPGISNRALSKR